MSKEAFFILAGTVGCTTCFFLTFLSQDAQTTPVDSGLEPKPQEVTPPQTEVLALPETTIILASPIPPSVSSDGWDCGSFINGPVTPERIKKKLMKLADPNIIEPGPYKLTHLDGSVQIIEDMDEFPEVFPKETICVENFEGRGFHPGGTIFEAAKHQNNSFAGKSLNIQAAIRSKQGF